MNTMFRESPIVISRIFIREDNSKNNSIFWLWIITHCSITIIILTHTFTRGIIHIAFSFFELKRRAK